MPNIQMIHQKDDLEGVYPICQFGNSLISIRKLSLSRASVSMLQSPQLSNEASRLEFDHFGQKNQMPTHLSEIYYTMQSRNSINQQCYMLQE